MRVQKGCCELLDLKRATKSNLIPDNVSSQANQVSSAKKLHRLTDMGTLAEPEMMKAVLSFSRNT